MTIGKHSSNDGTTLFTVFVLLVIVAVLGATFASLHDRSNLGAPMSRMALLYPVG